VLSCVDSGLATGLITRSRIPSYCKMQSLRLILIGKRREGLVRKAEEEEEEERKKEGIVSYVLFNFTIYRFLKKFNFPI
jgi:hypothetical protein